MLASHDRARDRGDNDLALAHTTAAFTRAAKLQPLTRYLQPQTPQSMADKLLAMAARTGARVTVVNRGD